MFAGNADGHDASHSRRVYRNALKLVQSHPEADILVVSLAALLHDVDDHKLFETENNENARSFLSEHGIDDGRADVICEVINGVSYSKNGFKVPETIEGRIVQDADRLDAVGAVAVARTFAYGGSRNRSLGESRQHLLDKCLRLAGGMHTAEAYWMALQRNAFLKNFLDELNEETDGLL